MMQSVKSTIKRKILSLVIGIVFISLLLIGVMFVVAPRVFSVVVGIVVVCLSLAFGMILPPEPSSFFALIVGICMIVFPPKIVGIVFVLLGIAGAVGSAILWVKKRNITE